jgi:glutamate N-acetyltransferase/amino-acid N-acetyltransferase
MNLPSGFKFSGVSCGIKASGKKDIALITSDVPAVAAGVYTQNVVRAASIDWNRQITPTDHLSAIVVNSGNANACTGEEGFRNNQKMAFETAGAVECTSGQVCVMSTGVIGQQLPMDLVAKGVKRAGNELGSAESDFNSACEAILTTDKGTKTAFRSFEFEGETVRLAGMAKGAGMIGPNMATMLGIVVTDASLTPPVAQDILKRVADRSFNCISVEGHTSTNDSLVLMANGLSTAPMKHWKALHAFTDSLTELCVELATQIPADGEGASHLISIKVSGAENDADADTVARSVAMSNLVKTAVAGADPNWGRITSAAGLTSVRFTPDELCLSINGTSIFEKGQPVAFDQQNLSQSMAENFETQVEIRIGSGAGEAMHWTSDLNEAYVKFNSLYTT